MINRRVSWATENQQCKCFIPSAKTLIYTSQEQPTLIQEEEMGRSQTM